jgi:hypothetical protein
MAHLFPGDGDEHGAVLSVGIARSNRSNRLLVRDVFLAKDGVDYVSGQRGYRMLRAEFVRDCAWSCSDERLGYLAVHNHGPGDVVDFSFDDLASHERGYPALVQLVDAPVGALVFSDRAVAGDIWLLDGRRVPLRSMQVIGPANTVLHPRPQPRGQDVDPRRHRQTLLLGDVGQQLLSSTKVGVIGTGGVGSLIISHLARLGVGHVVAIDPERIEQSNFSRIAGARESDFMPLLTRSRFHMLRSLGARWSKRKVDIAERVYRTANPAGNFEGIFGDVRAPEHVVKLLDCDYLFLAADTMQVRLLFNAIVHQYLIPGYQVGAKAMADQTTGHLTSVFSAARRVLPEKGCLLCNGLIPPGRLQEESLREEERRRQRYVDDPQVAAPSVITLNAVGSALATNAFLFAVTGLSAHASMYDYYRLDALMGEVEQLGARRDAGCLECGHTSRSRRARGDSVRLPTRLAS